MISLREWALWCSKHVDRSNKERYKKKCVKLVISKEFQKGTVLIYFAAEAWNQGIIKPRYNKATDSFLHLVHKPPTDSSVIWYMKLSLVCILLSPLTSVINVEERQWKFCVLHNVGHQFTILLRKQAQAVCVALRLHARSAVGLCVSNTHWELLQHRQCTYNVTLKRVRVTIVAMEKQ
jgi:hypothetical protein